MPLVHVFEILLIVAIIAGIFVGFRDHPVAKAEVKPDATPQT